MASISRIRAALGDALTNVPDLTVLPKLADTLTLGEGGAVSVGDFTAPEYQSSMGRGLVEYQVTLNVLASTAVYENATDTLDELVNPVGARSIANYLWENGRGAKGGLGVLDDNGKVDLDVYVFGLTAYGVEFVAAGIPHIGAVLTLTARTDARFL